MKTAKLFLTVAFISFAMMTFATDKPQPKPVEIKISLEQALNNKTLCSEMIKQLNADFIQIEHPGYYYATVRCGYRTFLIYGKYQEWLSFFNLTKWRQVKQSRSAWIRTNQ